MAGQGKYTRYRPVDPSAPLSTGGNSPPALGASRYSLLNQLFKTPPTLTTAADIHARANQFLTPAKQEADPILFPKGVYLNFQNPDPAYSAPNIPQGPFGPGGTGIGAPGNAFTPNTSSPDPSGAGSTSPVEPFVRTPDDVAPGIQIGTDGTVVPSVTSKEMFDGSQLPSGLVPGFRPGRTQ